MSGSNYRHAGTPVSSSYQQFQPEPPAWFQIVNRSRSANMAAGTLSGQQEMSQSTPPAYAQGQGDQNEYHGYSGNYSQNNTNISRTPDVNQAVAFVQKARKEELRNETLDIQKREVQRLRMEVQKSMDTLKELQQRRQPGLGSTLQNPQFLASGESNLTPRSYVTDQTPTHGPQTSQTQAHTYDTSSSAPKGILKMRGNDSQPYQNPNSGNTQQYGSSYQESYQNPYSVPDTQQEHQNFQSQSQRQGVANTSTPQIFPQERQNFLLQGRGESNTGTSQSFQQERQNFQMQRQDETETSQSFQNQRVHPHQQDEKSLLNDEQTYCNMCSIQFHSARTFEQHCRGLLHTKRLMEKTTGMQINAIEAEQESTHKNNSTSESTIPSLMGLITGGQKTPAPMPQQQQQLSPTYYTDGSRQVGTQQQQLSPGYYTERSRQDGPQQHQQQQSSPSYYTEGSRQDGQQQQSSPSYYTEGSRQDGQQQQSSPSYYTEGSRQDGQQQQSSPSCYTEGSRQDGPQQRQQQQSSPSYYTEGSRQDGQQQQSSPSYYTEGSRQDGQQQQSSPSCYTEGSRQDGQQQRQQQQSSPSYYTDGSRQDGPQQRQQQQSSPSYYTDGSRQDGPQQRQQQQSSPSYYTDGSRQEGSEQRRQQSSDGYNTERSRQDGYQQRQQQSSAYYNDGSRQDGSEQRQQQSSGRYYTDGSREDGSEQRRQQSSGRNYTERSRQDGYQQQQKQQQSSSYYTERSRGNESKDRQTSSAKPVRSVTSGSEMYDPWENTEEVKPRFLPCKICRIDIQSFEMHKEHIRSYNHNKQYVILQGSMASKKFESLYRDVEFGLPVPELGPAGREIVETNLGYENPLEGKAKNHIVDFFLKSGVLNNWHCRICKMTYTAETWLAHCSGKKHARACFHKMKGIGLASYMGLFGDLPGHTPLKDSSSSLHPQFDCITCDLTFHSEDQLRQHVSGIRHMRLVKKLEDRQFLSGTPGGTAGTVYDVLEGNEKSGNNRRCRICKASGFNADAWLSHCAGRKHGKACYMKIKTMGLANYLEAFGDIAGYFPLKDDQLAPQAHECSTCELRFTCPSQLREHLQGAKHMRELKRMAQLKELRSSETHSATSGSISEWNLHSIPTQISQPGPSSGKDTNLTSPELDSDFLSADSGMQVFDYSHGQNVLVSGPQPVSQASTQIPQQARKFGEMPLSSTPPWAPIRASSLETTPVASTPVGTTPTGSALTGTPGAQEPPWIKNRKLKEAQQGIAAAPIKQQPVGYVSHQQQEHQFKLQQIKLQNQLQEQQELLAKQQGQLQRLLEQQQALRATNPEQLIQSQYQLLQQQLLQQQQLHSSLQLQAAPLLQISQMQDPKMQQHALDQQQILLQQQQQILQKQQEALAEQEIQQALQQQIATIKAQEKAQEILKKEKERQEQLRKENERRRQEALKKKQREFEERKKQQEAERIRRQKEQEKRLREAAERKRKQEERLRREMEVKRRQEEERIRKEAQEKLVREREEKQRREAEEKLRLQTQMEILKQQTQEKLRRMTAEERQKLEAEKKLKQEKEAAERLSQKLRIKLIQQKAEEKQNREAEEKLQQQQKEEEEVRKKEEAEKVRQELQKKLEEHRAELERQKEQQRLNQLKAEEERKLQLKKLQEERAEKERQRKLAEQKKAEEERQRKRKLAIAASTSSVRTRNRGRNRNNQVQQTDQRHMVAKAPWNKAADGPVDKSTANQAAKRKVAQPWNKAADVPVDKSKGNQGKAAPPWNKAAGVPVDKSQDNQGKVAPPWNKAADVPVDKPKDNQGKVAPPWNKAADVPVVKPKDNQGKVAPPWNKAGNVPVDKPKDNQGKVAPPWNKAADVPVDKSKGNQAKVAPPWNKAAETSSNRSGKVPPWAAPKARVKEENPASQGQLESATGSLAGAKPPWVSNIKSEGQGPRAGPILSSSVPGQAGAVSKGKLDEGTAVDAPWRQDLRTKGGPAHGGDPGASLREGGYRGRNEDMRGPGQGRQRRNQEDDASPWGNKRRRGRQEGNKQLPNNPHDADSFGDRVNPNRDQRRDSDMRYQNESRDVDYRKQDAAQKREAVVEPPWHKDRDYRKSFGSEDQDDRMVMDHGEQQFPTDVDYRNQSRPDVADSDYRLGSSGPEEGKGREGRRSDAPPWVLRHNEQQGSKQTKVIPGQTYRLVFNDRDLQIWEEAQDGFVRSIAGDEEIERALGPFTHTLQSYMGRIREAQNILPEAEILDTLGSEERAVVEQVQATTGLEPRAVVVVTLQLLQAMDAQVFSILGKLDPNFMQSLITGTLGNPPSERNRGANRMSENAPWARMRGQKRRFNGPGPRGGKRARGRFGR